MIVQNMPGAGSVVTANYVFSVAKADGLTLGMPANTIYMDQLAGRKEVQFDVRRFNWIGTQDKRHLVFYMRADSPGGEEMEVLAREVTVQPPEVVERMKRLLGK